MSGACWLVKSEAECFSIRHLQAAPRHTTHWDGVRNYQARNYLRAMQVGDRVLYYHSNANPPGVAGTAVVVRTAYPDFTAWDPREPHFDPKASPENPIWDMVDLRLGEIFPREVSLPELRSVTSLAGLELLRTGSRLSVHPVTTAEFETIVALGHAPPEETTSPTASPPGRPVRRPVRQPARKRKA